jgi:hypothetical protein
MKRFHVHVSVASLDDSIRFYSKLFGTAPTVTKPDYAKWMLDDPRINFAISQRGRLPGVNHLGLQVDSAEELEALNRQCAEADIATTAEAGANCCYARSDKYWIADPQGIAWEAFHTLGDIPIFGDNAAPGKSESACCPPPAVSQTGKANEACCAPAADTGPATAKARSACCG